jgi:hypothetical protein
MIRSAVLAFDDLCRLELRRIWDPALPLAAWLMLNPSKADHEIDDPTVGRVCHFSRKAGAGGAIVVNVTPWRATDPEAMMRALVLGDISFEMLSANMASIEAASAEASIHFAAFGVVPSGLGWHRSRALERFAKHSDQLLCLGQSPGGWPLHPLARGKFAIRNDSEPGPWIQPA